MQRICHEANKGAAANNEVAGPQKKVLHRNYITDLDNFNQDVVLSSIQELYD